MPLENTSAAKSSVSTDATFAEMSNAIRALSMDAVEKAKSGHPGMPMGMADIATVLFGEFLKFDASNPNWADRDRFVLSNGHGSMLLYSVLHLTGYADMTLDELKNFRQLGSRTAGHPEFGYAAGIETTTGPLGQGIANAVGMALAERLQAARFGDDVVNHYTYVFTGDGCLMEGVSQEAISLAGHLKLNKLIVLFDDNSISIDGDTNLAISEDTLARFAASGWATAKIDGHNADEIRAAIKAAQKSDKPTLIACRTTIAYGAPTKAGTAASHGSPLGADEITGARTKLSWAHAPFEVPEHVRLAWRKAGSRSADERKAWEGRLNKKDASVKADFLRTVKGDLPAAYKAAAEAFKKQLAETKPKEATRQSSYKVLEALTPVVAELIGGSADLTGSNLTKAKAQKGVSATDFSGSYIYYGVREHGMCAAMNGIALHGGFIPYGGTFFIFTDYCRPSIRLAALMKQRVVYVMTHDSIGLGEDGPTHQPVEHMASFRAMPNVQTIRPADATETLEAWQLALETTTAPTMLVLTRQGLPHLRNTYTSENLTAKGGYVISPATGKEQVTLIATGSEVSLAVEAQKALAEKGIVASVVSMPCTTLFDKQDAAYRNSILPKNTLKVAIEAGCSFGWERYTGQDGIFIGLDTFGESAPAEALYKHFGITVENVVAKVTEKLK